MSRPMGVFKKRHTVPCSRDVAQALDGLSKQALLDCLVDAIARAEGVEPDALTLDAVSEFCNPRLRLRGDPTLDVVVARQRRQRAKAAAQQDKAAAQQDEYRKICEARKR